MAMTAVEPSFSLDEILQGAGKIGITGHIRPDGDCIGACLGLRLYIETYYPQTQVKVYLEEIPDVFRFLQGSGQIIHTPDPDEDFDLFFILDCSDMARLGDFAPMTARAGMTVCIDHHITNGMRCDRQYVDPEASSASELVCNLLDPDRITFEAAEALYLGIAHDTGIFRYSNTSSHTMRLAGMLMDKGIDFTRIVDETFYTKNYNQKQILGRALLESIRLLDGQVIFSVVRIRDLEFFQVDKKDLDGIVQELRSIRGVHTAVFLSELAPFLWKVSMRSDEKVDVASIAAHFGGGGHRRAAGCTMPGNMHDVVNNITLYIEEQLKAACITE